MWQNIFNKFWFKLIFQNNLSWASNQFIRLISEGSRDTEDWSNDAENTAFKYFEIENSYFKLQYYSQYNFFLAK